MAPSTAKKPDLPELPDIAKVLRAIQNDPVPRRDDKTAQNELLRRLVKKNHPRLLEDELQQSTDRLRNRLKYHWKEHSRRTIPQTVGKSFQRTVLGPRPFRQLFHLGFSAFPQEHLDELGIEWPSDDENDDTIDGDDGDDDYGEQEVGNVTAQNQDHSHTPDFDVSSEQTPSAGTTIGVVQSKKRKADEVDLSATIPVSGAARGKRSQQPTIASAPPGIASASTDSAFPLPEDSNNIQSQDQHRHGQEVGAILPKTPAARRNATSRKVNSTSDRRHDSADHQVCESRPMEPSPVQGTAHQRSNGTHVNNIIIPHQDWVDAQMRSIEFNIWQAANAYSQQKERDELAVAKFVTSQEPGLAALYKQVFGLRWQTRLCDTQDDGAPLKQIYVTQALFGAAIHKAVLAQDSLGDLRHQIKAGLDVHRKYLDATLIALGHDPEHLLKNVAFRQAADLDYQKTVVADQARQLAGSTALTMLPHLQKQSCRIGIGEQLNYKRWILYLEEAFGAASTLKQITMYSELGPFEIRWPRSGEGLDFDAHRLSYELGQKTVEGATATVLHGTLPGVWKKTDDSMLAYCMALVVPVASKEAGQ